MKYFIGQLILLIVSVTILYYFGTLPYFKPFNSDLTPNWYNFVVVIALLSLAAEALVSLAIFTLMKLFIYGRRENPPIVSTLKWGFCAALLVPILLVLNVFHILSLEWGVLLVVVFVIGFTLLK